MHLSSLFQVQFYLQLLIQMYNIKSMFVVTKLTATITQNDQFLEL